MHVAVYVGTEALQDREAALRCIRAIAVDRARWRSIAAKCLRRFHQTTPAQVVAGQINLLLAGRQDIAIDHGIQLSI